MLKANKIIFTAWIVLLLAVPVKSENPAITSMRILVEGDAEPEYGYVYEFDDILKENAISITDIFEDIADVDVVTKGLPELQNNVKFNEGTYEQTGVLFEGIKMNNPQTGHYNFDIPITLLDIGRIDVVNNASLLAGSGGFSGLINIKTPQISEAKSKLVTGYGTYNTFYYGARLVKSIGKKSGINVSGEKSNSDGYHKGTDYDRFTGFMKYEKKGSFNIMAGYGEKDYGAYDFYTPGKGNASREKIKMFFSILDWNALKDVRIKAHISTHHDTFVLDSDVDESSPSYYKNEHDTFVWSTEAVYKWLINTKNRILIKYMYDVDSIESSNLGNHNRHRNTGLVTGFFNFAKIININLNLGAEKYIENENYDIMPSGTLSIAAIKDFNIYGSYSHAIRYPNYTELYYSGGGSIGNPDLLAERTHVFDGGIKMNIDKAKINVSGFYRANYDLIDWAKDLITDSDFQTQNIGEVNVIGMTAGIHMPVDNMDVKVNYTYLDSYRSKDYISKYGLAYLRNKLSVVADIEILTIGIRFKYIYKKYIKREEPLHAFDLSVTRDLSKWSRATIKIKNMLNTYYEEIEGIPAPGRFIIGSVEAGF